MLLTCIREKEARSDTAFGMAFLMAFLAGRFQARAHQAVVLTQHASRNTPLSNYCFPFEKQQRLPLSESHFPNQESPTQIRFRRADPPAPDAAPLRSVRVRGWGSASFSFRVACAPAVRRQRPSLVLFRSARADERLGHEQQQRQRQRPLELLVVLLELFAAE